MTCNILGLYMVIAPVCYEGVSLRLPTASSVPYCGFLHRCPSSIRNRPPIRWDASSQQHRGRSCLPGTLRPKTLHSAKGIAAVPRRRWPVALYLPNILCYMRILLAFYGLYMAGVCVTASQASQCINQSPAWLGADDLSIQQFRYGILRVFGVAGLLDLIDGWLARRLNQCSGLGELLDVLADNVLRSCMWLTSAMLGPTHIHRLRLRPLLLVLALFLTSLEHTTLLATQSLKATDGRHWKLRGLGDPPFVRRFFRCGFLNPEGGIGIAGLYLCPLLPCLAATFPHITRKFPLPCTLLVCVLGLGRVLSLRVEAHFIARYTARLDK